MFFKKTSPYKVFQQ